MEGGRFKMEYVLYHHGIKGMRWGVRRYQNKDGTLTNAGQRRYTRDQRENSGKKKGNKVGEADPNRWVHEDLTRSKRLADETSTFANRLKNINDSELRNRPKVKMDLSSMTDKQMREEINRALLERQYNDMFAPQKVSKGRDFATAFINVASTTIPLIASSLGIALAVKELKG